MDPEIKKELEEIHALVKDNHQLIRAVRRHQLYGIVSTVVFWAVLLITPLYIYQQYLQPMIAKFSASNGTSSGTFSLPTSAEVQNLINSYKVGK